MNVSLLIMVCGVGKSSKPKASYQSCTDARMHLEAGKAPTDSANDDRPVKKYSL